jgi:hypothetical protein
VIALNIITVKPAYIGAARDRVFSVASRLLLIQVLEVKLNILGTKKVFR